MIKSKTELNNIISFEKNIYCQYMFQTRLRRIMAFIKREPSWLILKWQMSARFVDYYKYRLEHTPKDRKSVV